MNGLSCGVTMCAQVFCLVTIPEFERQTYGRTNGLTERPLKYRALKYMYMPSHIINHNDKAQWWANRKTNTLIKAGRP